MLEAAAAAEEEEESDLSKETNKNCRAYSPVRARFRVSGVGFRV